MIDDNHGFARLNNSYKELKCPNSQRFQYIMDEIYLSDEHLCE